MSDWESLVSAITVRPRGGSILSEGVTVVSLDTEGAGAFVVVDQSAQRDEVGKIAITPEEWPTLRRAIDAMMRVAKKEAT